MAEHTGTQEGDFVLGVENRHLATLIIKSQSATLQILHRLVPSCLIDQDAIVNGRLQECVSGRRLDLVFSDLVK